MAAFPTSTFHRQRQSGVTLIEMLVAIAILAILASIAAPSFQRLIADTRLTTQANDFLTAVNYTRSEAIKHNRRVTMCASSDSATCAANGNWNQGWIIFVDGGPNAGAVDNGEPILRVQAALSNGSTLIGNNNVTRIISYLPNGQARTTDAVPVAQSGAITLCSNNPQYPGRTITIAAGPGRPSVESERPACQ